MAKKFPPPPIPAELLQASQQDHEPRPTDPVTQVVQLYRVRINNIDHILFGPPLLTNSVSEPSEPSEPSELHVTDFAVGPEVPMTTILHTLQQSLNEANQHKRTELQ